MPSPKIQMLNDSYYKGTMGFDQFVLGATLAACAYLAQTATYDQLDWNPSTLQLLPLLLLGFTAFFGFKRIESSIQTIKLNSAYLQLLSDFPGNAFPEQRGFVQQESDRSGFYYGIRNKFILLSFLAFVSVKILVKYNLF